MEEGLRFVIVALPGLSLTFFCYPSSAHPSTPLNDFFFVIPGPLFFKLHVELFIKRGLKIYTNGHNPLITRLIKIASVPIYGENT